MFTAALFTIAKTCKQPKCPSTYDYIKKSNDVNDICSNMDATREYHTK